MKTFEQWQRDGFVVVYGQKALYEDRYGRPLFGRAQVIPVQRPQYNSITGRIRIR